MSELNHPWIDTHEAPLFVVRFPTHSDDDAMEKLYAHIREFYAVNTTPFAWVVDTRRIADTRASQRRITAEHQTKVRQYMAQHCAGMAFVIDKAFLRGVLKAVYWLAPPQYPYRVFKDLGPALAWARAQLQDHRAASPQASVPG